MAINEWYNVVIVGVQCEGGVNDYGPTGLEEADDNTRLVMNEQILQFQPGDMLNWGCHESGLSQSQNHHADRCCA